MMPNRGRLSLAEAREIAGIITPSRSSPPPDVFERRTSTKALTAPGVAQNGKPGSSLKDRFAAVVRSKGSERQSTRGPDRVLIGRKATLKTGAGDGQVWRNIGGVTHFAAEGGRAGPSPPIRRCAIASLLALGVK